MAQQPSPQDLETALDLPFASTERPAQSAVRSATRPQVRVRRYAIRQVVVVEVAGRLSDVVEDLDHAIKVALGERSRGVVCDLTDLTDLTHLTGMPSFMEDAEEAAVEVLASAGRHLRDWPGIPVAVACPDPRVRQALSASPLGRHLILTSSLFAAMTAVLATRTLTVERLHLAPDATAPRVARDFVTRTLLGWRLGPVVPFASLVITELVANATMDASDDVEVSIVWNLGALRLTVRDNGPELPPKPYSHVDPHGRRLSVVAVLSSAFGVLPTADGGKVVWAVLDAPRPL